MKQESIPSHNIVAVTTNARVTPVSSLHSSRGTMSRSEAQKEAQKKAAEEAIAVLRGTPGISPTSVGKGKLTLFRAALEELQLVLQGPEDEQRGGVRALAGLASPAGAPAARRSSSGGGGGGGGSGNYGSANEPVSNVVGMPTSNVNSRKTLKMSNKKIRVADYFPSIQFAYGSMAGCAAIDTISAAGITVPQLPPDVMEAVLRHVLQPALRMIPRLQLQLESSYVLLTTQIVLALCEVADAMPSASTSAASAALASPLDDDFVLAEDLEEDGKSCSTWGHCEPQTLMHSETPPRMDGFVQGRVELQFSRKHKGQDYLAGVCELGRHLGYKALEDKVQQLQKELLTVWATNAAAGIFRPVFGLLGDGYCFMLVVYTGSQFVYKPRMRREDICGHYHCSKGTRLWGSNLEATTGTGEAIALLVHALCPELAVCSAHAVQEAAKVAAARLEQRLDTFAEMAVALSEAAAAVHQRGKRAREETEQVEQKRRNLQIMQQQMVANMDATALAEWGAFVAQLAKSRPVDW